MNVEIVKITPEIARDWLQKNHNFRDPVELNIERMSRDIASGKWDENGESIKFNGDGTLVDGQNRLMACIKAGKPFTSVVVYGVKSDLNIDVGAKRALKHYLKKHGVEKYQCDVAAALRSLWIFRKYGTVYTAGAGSQAPTNHELIRFFKGEPKLIESVVAVSKLKPISPPSLTAALLVLFSEKDEVLAKKYIDGLAAEIELTNTDPVSMLRERLISDRGAKYRMSARCKAALMIIAWNHWRTGTTVKILKWAESGPTKMEFPEIE